ncbi:helix-hairpin-helix domain-containing protein [Turicibacter sanguinis]|jgi:competence protein comEA helix-hairpin-helix repeat region|uniref:helix-hairpin-helix domain-containing protein n=2 Tax=Turicibacteraceae TaxID=2810281 RepID=UPI0001FDB40D|nr:MULTISPECIES: helix-hairpin-helix domain-containing protein [Turicibacter]EGC90667.1 comEA protein [Turicibacter sp. HGF1]MBP3903941.1 helix-hairpin-helix domain-containing protein [Turicibacter sp.]MCU7197885.1 helix-hairpin-helix domain-containing protein [Turicibacter sanguinis]MCU7203534.1 helix-hairpin-helix domain-containing protein [Turicibacter sanguinis]MDB8438100.1 helix-hairpin-helix domain-containing protein [Turicibacter sanguinis]
MKKQLVYLFVSGIVMSLIFMSAKPKNTSVPIVIESQSSIEEITKSELEEVSSLYYIIDVKGEVYCPGVYEVEANSRIHEVILLAGGLTEQADQNAINLAGKIKDEMVIYVPHVEEVVNFQWSFESSSESKKISINQANEDELKNLPGIGKTKAAAIIQYRMDYGPFQSIEELKNVTGIGEKTFESLEDFIEL